MGPGDCSDEKMEAAGTGVASRSMHRFYISALLRTCAACHVHDRPFECGRRSHMPKCVPHYALLPALVPQCAPHDEPPGQASSGRRCGAAGQSGWGMAPWLLSVSACLHLRLVMPPSSSCLLVSRPPACLLVWVLQSPADEKMIPLVNHGVKCMSMGFLMDEDVAAVWRGPMVHPCCTHAVWAAMWRTHVQPCCPVS